MPAVETLISTIDSLDDFEPAVRGRAERLVVQTDAIISKIIETKVPASEAHDETLEARIQAAFNFSFHDELGETAFEKPTLIVSGRQDSIAGYADALDMLTRFPRSTFGLLDCAGHSLTWERPELFRALFVDWLTRMECAY